MTQPKVLLSQLKILNFPIPKKSYENTDKVTGNTNSTDSREKNHATLSIYCLVRPRHRKLSYKTEEILGHNWIAETPAT